MTHDEFLKGWCLLVVQPWGQRYNRTTSDGEPAAEAKLQLEFYYDKLKHGSAEAWFQTAEQYAMGDEWPTVVALRTTMRHRETSRVELTYNQAVTYAPMPDAIKALVRSLFGRPVRYFGPFVDESVPEQERS